MSNSRNKRIKRGAFHRFYLISPKENADASSLVNKLLSLKPVQEVFLTDGDFGYLVKARFYKGDEPNDIVDYMAKRLDSRFGKIMSYYQYKK